MKTKSIHQEIEFDAAPMLVYECLVNPKKHSAFTQAVATNTDSLTKPFEVYDGYAHGKNNILQAGAAIEQTWRAWEDAWPETHFSTIKMTFKSNGKKGTLLLFDQLDIPEACAKSIDQGWHEHYWYKLQAYLAR